LCDPVRAATDPIGLPSLVPGTLVTGPQPAATLQGPFTDPLPSFYGSLPCSQQTFTITYADTTVESATGCAISGGGNARFNDYVSVGGQDAIVDGFPGGVVPTPTGWLAYSCAGVVYGCEIGTTSAPQLVTEPIPTRNGRVGPAAKFSGFTPFRYANGDPVAVETSSVAESADGRWLAVKTSGRNTLARIDTSTGTVLPFALALVSSQGLSDVTPLAIDPSGQFVAQGQLAWGGSGPLVVWDMAPCVSPPADAASLATGCASQTVGTLSGDAAFAPGRTLDLSWVGSNLNFAAGTLGSSFAMYNLVPKPAAAQYALSLVASPASPTVDHTVTLAATVRNATASDVVAGVSVIFQVTAGPNSGFTSTGVTNAAGVATISLKSNGVGSDTVEVWADSNNNGIQDPNEPSVQTVVDWKPPVFYAALGDSYSSGEGAPDFMPGTFGSGPDQCHRSYQAYATDAAGTRGFPPLTQLRFAACSGATIGSFYQSYSTEPPQLDVLKKLGDSAGLVSLTVGGNDVEFPYVVAGCIVLTACQYKLDSPIRALIAKTSQRLFGLYANILAAVPKAAIYVLGYPRLFSPSPPLYCNGIDRGEALWFNSMVNLLDSQIQQQVASIGNPRLKFVDTASAFAGGELCSSNVPVYMNGLVLSNLSYSFHPTAAGQAHLAYRLEAAVRVTN
jgi:hypothetical protein